MNIHTKDTETFLTTFTGIVSDNLASGEPVVSLMKITIVVATMVILFKSRYFQLLIEKFLGKKTRNR